MFKELNPLLHSELRLAVMSLLIGVEEADFVFIRQQTGATAGNLSVQIDKLNKAGYVEVTKTFKIWVLWLLWVEPWDGQCLRLQVRPLSAPVLPVSIRWKFANVMLWVLLWPCWQAWSFCCSDFSKERPLLLRAFFYLFIYNTVFCKKSAFCSTMLNIFL